MTTRTCADCQGDARAADGSYATRREERGRQVRLVDLCRRCAAVRDAAKGGKR